MNVCSKLRAGENILDLCSEKRKAISITCIGKRSAQGRVMVKLFMPNKIALRCYIYHVTY